MSSSVAILSLGHLRRALLSRLAIAFPGSLALLPSRAPLRLRRYAGDRREDRLVIFLPGIRDVADDFEAQGFIAALAASGLRADAVAVDAHYGYYARRSVVERLAQDVVLPARRCGYRDIWLVGISLGGLGALLYVMHHPEHVSRALLIAPYLGDDRTIAETAGSPERVRAEEGTDVARARGTVEFTRRLWNWLALHDFKGASAPHLYLGYGTEDRLAAANALLAARLAAQHALAVTGGHDWRTWGRLWNAFLASWASEPARSGLRGASPG